MEQDCIISIENKFHHRNCNHSFCCTTLKKTEMESYPKLHNLRSHHSFILQVTPRQITHTNEQTQQQFLTHQKNETLNSKTKLYFVNWTEE